MATSGDRLVWVLRHAKTSASPPPGGSDFDRRLTARGKRDADALGDRLAAGADRLGMKKAQIPELVLCSSAARTTQTAARVWARAQGSPPIEHLRTLYHASSEEVLGQLRLIDDEVRSVMVVGHNPTVHNLVADLIRPDDEAGRASVVLQGFPTCALAVFEVPAPGWADLAEGSAMLLGLFLPPF